MTTLRCFPTERLGRWVVGAVEAVGEFSEVSGDLRVREGGREAEGAG